MRLNNALLVLLIFFVASCGMFSKNTPANADTSVTAENTENTGTNGNENTAQETDTEAVEEDTTNIKNDIQAVAEEPTEQESLAEATQEVTIETANEDDFIYDANSGVNKGLFVAFVKYLETYNNYVLAKNPSVSASVVQNNNAESESNANQTESATQIDLGVGNNQPYIISEIPLLTDTLVHATSLPFNATPLARSIFVYNKPITATQVKNLANYVGAGVVVYKAFYNPDDKNYTYDIVFLGTSDAKQSILDSILENNASDSTNELLKTSTWKEYLKTENLPKTKKGKIDLQKAYLQYVTNAAKKGEGLWEDIATGEVIEVIKSLDDGDIINSNYYAYVVQNKNLIGEKLIANSDFSWQAGDVRFKFSSLNFDGAYFVNQEKMYVKSNIILSTPKNAIVVPLPNRRVKYYIPYLQGVPKKIKRAVYTELQSVKKVTEYHKTPVNRFDNVMDSSKSFSDIIVGNPFVFGFLTLISLGVGIPYYVAWF